MLALQAQTPVALAKALGASLPEARRIVSAVHRGVWGAGARTPLQGVRRVIIEAAAHHAVPRLDVRAEVRSAIDPFVKLSLASPDGAVFEAVRIPLERAGRFSACVSSQVRCAVGCVFCATGPPGLPPNLEVRDVVGPLRVLPPPPRAGPPPPPILLPATAHP